MLQFMLQIAHKILSSKSRNKRLQCYDWWENFFDQPVKIKMRTYHNIWKIATGEGDDYTTGCLLDYNYFNKHYKMIAKDLSKKSTWCWSKSNTTN